MPRSLSGSAPCRVAEALVICCRDIDSAVRFGGDEFAVVLPETGREAANSVALRICATIQNDDKGPNLSVSLGVALYPEDGGTVESLMKAADAAMYGIKREKSQLRTLEAQNSGDDSSGELRARKSAYRIVPVPQGESDASFK